VLIALMVDIGLDSYWHGADFKDSIIEELEAAGRLKLNENNSG
jgi:hypothetical protein